MPENPNKLSQFWHELRRRKVIRVISVYAAAAFVILELTDIVAPSLGLPDWTLNFIIILLCVGFIIAVIFSWLYDIHPEGGIVKTGPLLNEKKEESPVSSKGWKIATLVSAVIIITLLVINLFGNRGKVSRAASLEKSIAVLPMLNLSGDPGKEYISDGLTNDIITQLSRIQSFDKVVSLTSVLTYKDQGKKSTEIAEELGVNYLLESTYSQAEGKLKVVTRLVEPRNDENLWQHEYNRPLEEIISLRTEIALEVAHRLEAYISKPEKQRIQQVSTTNQEAWEKYQLGLFHRRKGRDEEGLKTARTLLEETIALDPEFALAHTALADIYLRLYWYRYDVSPLILAKSREAIDAAFSIDPGLPEAIIELADYYYAVFLDYPRALELLQKASEFMPDHFEIHFQTALNYRRMGKWEEAVAEFEKALKYDPRNLNILDNLAESYSLLQRYEEALNIAGTGIEVDPGHFISYENQFLAYLLRDGNTREARKVLEEIKKLNLHDKMVNQLLYIATVEVEIFDGNYAEALNFLSGSDWKGLINTAEYYPGSLFRAMVLDLQDLPEQAGIYYDSARIELEAKRSEFKDDPRFSGPLGICYAGLGIKEMAIRLGEKAVEEYSMEKDAFFGLIRVEELAWIYVMVEEYDAALAQIEILLSNPGPYSAPFLKLDPKWKPLWDHPEFIRLTRKYATKESG